MAFPNFEGKHDHEAIITPAAMAAYRARRGLVPGGFVPPRAAIVTYQPYVFSRAAKRYAVTAHRVGLQGELVTFDHTGGAVAMVGRFGFGAPIAAIMVEDLIALGVERIISLGLAGALAPGLRIGELLVCHEAVRDEGVSHHYLPAAERAQASPALTAALAAELTAAGAPFRRGVAWTIDAVYRETVAEARHYVDQGVDCVEMEAAALFTVAAVRGVELAGAFCISDLLAGGEWSPQFESPDLAERLAALLDAAVRTLEAPA
ncbi:MAG: nucleoside phosphorylase [Acidimicrobiales bacterium]